MTRYRVARGTTEIATGATFGPGEEVVGVDPDNPEDARKIEEGYLVALQEQPKREPSEAVVKKAAELEVDLANVKGTGAKGAILVADVEAVHDNQEESK